MIKKKNQPRLIQAIDRAVNILDYLAENNRGLTLKQLSEKMGLSAQATLNLVRTLQALGMARQDEKGQPYMLGPHVHELAEHYRAGKEVLQAAREPVLTLAQTVKEYTMLAEMQDGAVVRLLDVPAEQFLAVRAESQSFNHSYAMATGKILLAYMPGRTRKEALAKIEFKKLTDKTITSRMAFEKELTKIKKQEYAVCVDEAVEGVAAIAVSIRDHSGAVLTALGICVPSVRFAKERQVELLDKLRETAKEIEKRCGL